MAPAPSTSAVRPPPRRPFRCLTFAVLLALAACGPDAPRSSPEAPARSLPSPTPEGAAPRGEREVLTEDDEAYHRGQALKPRDTPLAVGAQAPAFPGLPERTLAVLVFFRGEW